ncbi:endonuclease/exonuclease/phosphatase family protein [Roseivirga sp. E12]|uniref:endonuclease/exonuclease/phosphatase family protein n=1 Tax=Roseivirga sp. E12 TaxID=2819237 RepID=UPI001ABC7A28|nr:endonuclease/exonuclease/phosphatase family protein [Roseivirga sp. E12]MBO3696953.1 endonuclease/exonuclease/phosphatase family protein [Roseivirga sp. E12]
MKKFLLLSSIVLAISISLPTIAQTHSFLSYNIRYNNPNDGMNKWDDRKDAVVALINHYDPLVFGIQEGLISQVQFIKDKTTRYDYLGVGRDDGKTKGELSAVFYDTEKVTLLKEGTFWLSKTPDKVSKDWDAALPRICTYGQFEVKATKEVFWFFNTHFDHIGKVARANSASLIVQKIKEIAGSTAPIILSGDFNATPNSQPILNITRYMKDGYSDSQNEFYGPIGTFSGFDISAKLENRIDYIFFRNINAVSLSHIDDRRQNGLWVSDHLPVLLKARF